jgi:UDP-N-acetylmuramoyl-tripeptide--D-alanyl-D-alanine ligase
MRQKKFTIEDLFNIPSAVIYNPDGYKSTAKVFIDSRKVTKDSIFVAIRGRKFNGHDFVKDAVNKGAATVIIQRNKLKEFDDVDCTIITVQNTVKAYAELAKIWRRKNKYKVVSITGSAGKTTTKEMIADILSEKYKVVKSVANNNNHIGVPLTILSATGKHEILVLEHGTNHFNEIDFTAKIAEPDLALITNVGDSHLEYLIDREGVYKEKSALFGEALKNSGKIIINNNDEIIKGNTKGITNKVSFGFKVKADYKGKVKGYNKYGQPVVGIESKKMKLKEYSSAGFGKC